MKIGCVKEQKKHEYRVGLTPDNVRDFLLHGHEVTMESGAGEGSSFSDEEYIEAGATIASAKEVWAGSEMVVKVKEPLENEYDFLRKDQILFTYLHLAANKQLTQVLMEKGTKAVAYETVRGRNGGLPLLKPMSEVAGRLSVLEGSKYLEKPSGGMGILLGGVPGAPRANILILGGGVVGTNACKMAVGLGASVSIMDTNLDRLEYLDDIFGQSIQTLYSSPSALTTALAQADLVIGAVLIPGAASPKLIRKEHLKIMKNGSVIVDVAVDQGGCCETSHPTYHDDPVFTLDGVVHYCVGNMPGAVSRTSTIALTNATLPFGLAIASKGLEKATKANKGLLPGINCYGGKLTNKEVAKALGMPYEDIEGVLG